MNETRIPVKYEIIQPPLADNRFTPVRILLMHTGLNLNNSVFTKECIEKAIPTLANIPILGFVAVDKKNKADFRGHEEQLVVRDDELKIEYLGSAYGVIPESNNARFKMIDNKEYLVVDGLIYNMFEDAKEILDRDEFKNQSMELFEEGLTGEWIDGSFHFQEFTFRGACLLGDDVLPAMEGSKIIKEQVFNYSFSYSEDITKAIRDFNTESNKYERSNDMDFEKMYNETLELLNAKISEFEVLTSEFENIKSEKEAIMAEKEVLFSEKEELVSFKNEIMAEQRKQEEVELFAKFEGKVDEAIITEMKEMASELAIADLEMKLYAELGKASLVEKAEEVEEETEFEVKFTKKSEETLKSLVESILK